MPIGKRLREERERLGLSQPAFAAVAGTTKQTLFSWETGKTAPDGFQLAALATTGADVLYILTGQRDPAAPALDAAEQVLVDSYRRCNAQARQNLIQTAALLSAGLGAAPGRASSQAPASVSIGDMRNTTPGGVQVGYAGGDVKVKKGR
ncbi:MAG: helix-turn-helix transcriptional regulator [Burkholderiaceae bacterium]|nr:helix-turn-helix transcriptional regulator [Burkholderiaceae bacterium]